MEYHPAGTVNQLRALAFKYRELAEKAPVAMIDNLLRVANRLEVLADECEVEDL
jgi:hypothetical protein